MGAALDGEGRRSLRPHAHVRPRRLAAAGGRADDQRARLDRLLRADGRGSPPTLQRALGHTADAERYRTLFARIRADFNARFLGADGVYREKPEDGFVQTAQVLPLAFDLVPDDRRAAVAERLAGRHHEPPRRATRTSGVLGARYVLPVLTATGHHDVAFAVATQTDEPSWGYWTDTLGFTALGESWPADTRSRNHHFFGAIVQWLYEDLAGIRPLQPGYAGSSTGRRSRAPVSITCPRRTRACAAWSRANGAALATAVALDISVPANARGRVYVPAAEGERGTGDWDRREPARREQRPASRWSAARTAASSTRSGPVDTSSAWGADDNAGCRPQTAGCRPVWLRPGPDGPAVCRLQPVALRFLYWCPAPTWTSPRISPPGLWAVWTLTYAIPLRSAATSSLNSPVAKPCVATVMMFSGRMVPVTVPALVGQVGVSADVAGGAGLNVV